MPNLHDIERRIGSVTSTKQITRTMEMVAAAKIRHAGERVEAARPYASSMSGMLRHVAERAGEAQAGPFAPRDVVSKAIVLVIVSDRGLAGGFNTNVLRHAEKLVAEREAAGQHVELVCCGKKAVSYFAYRGLTPALAFADLSADPTQEEAATLATYVVERFASGEADEFVMVYNHAKNAAEQVLREQRVLPLDPADFAEEALPESDQEAFTQPVGTPDAPLEFEPSAEAVLERLVPAFVRTMVFTALVDSALGEQGARRSAMKSATDNANDMVETLTRIYNRVRQSAITTEISEIVGGAAALEE